MSDIKPGDTVTTVRTDKTPTFKVVAIDGDQVWLKPTYGDTANVTWELEHTHKVSPKWEKDHVYGFTTDALWKDRFTVVHVTPNGHAAIVWNATPNSVNMRDAERRTEYHDVTELAAQQLREVP